MSSRINLTWHRAFVVAALAGLLSQAGCTQVAVLGKWLVGDPKVDAAFKATTGKSLEKGARVALVCTAPDGLVSGYDAVALDLREELYNSMDRRGIVMVDADEVSDALDELGGTVDATELSRKLEIDYLLHVDVEFFDYRAPNSPRLFHGRAVGLVYGYEVRETPDSDLGQHAVQVFEREFHVEYPGPHPVPVDQTPERVFRNRFIDQIAADLGRLFYDFRTNEAF
jgi:hypothetical protein